MTVFLRTLEAGDSEKAGALYRAVTAVASPGSADAAELLGRTVFERAPEDFTALPGSPFAYWIGDNVRALFKRFPALERDGRTAKQGIATADDFRFVRALWEIGDSNRVARWVPFAKGGRYSPYYADIHLVVNWLEDGREICNFRKPGSERIASRPQNLEYMMRPGLTWSDRTTKRFSARAWPPGGVFSVKGSAGFFPGCELFALAVLNSSAFSFLLSLLVGAGDAAARSYQVGTIGTVPWPRVHKPLEELARRAFVLKRSLDMTEETSRAFLLPQGLNSRVTGLRPENVEQELESIQRTIDESVFQLYGISAEDRTTMDELSSRVCHDTGSVRTDVEDDEAEEDADEGEPATAGADALNSWLVGVAFGRFDPRLATGERVVPPEPGPFDPLPWRSPGMYPEGEQAADAPDILVDDEGHANDLAARAQAVAEHVKVDVPEDLRGWLAKEFFPLHIKMYSKSRRKAPIYWQLATSPASYSVWLYVHAFSRDTLFRLQNDYVAPKVAHEERRLESQASELRDGTTAAQRKQLAAQEALVDELRGFLEEVKRVAPLWNPNLDDGVIINFAPLWRLVPQNKAWQKELKAAWDALCEGKYDWAHLAMHLWPERVVPKCANDRSLAIAHGLEDVFWVEGAAGKWAARKAPTRNIDDLVRERTSAAVKSALKSLLEAPAPGGTAKRTRKGKTHA